MKHLEKFIFLLVFLVVAGIAGWVFLGKTDAPSVTGNVPPLSGTFDLAEYEGLPDFPDVQWSAPEAQDSEGKWLFRIFTPPKLYIVDGAFVVELPVIGPPPPPPPPPTPFGVRLAEIDRKKYRLQLDAVYETELNNLDSAVLSFENVYATQTQMPTISLEKGETHPVYNFRVDEIRKIQRDVGGGSETEHIATITDLESGKVLLLSDSETLFEEGVTFVFASTESAGDQATAESVGDSFAMNDATYTLSEINLESSSVELVKEADYLDVPESETLTINSKQPSEPSPNPVPVNQPNADDTNTDLDSFFN